MKQLASMLIVTGVAVGWLLLADTLELDDGSRLVGELGVWSGGKVRITTAFAGTLEVDQTRVVAVTTTAPRTVTLAAGEMVVGRLAAAGAAPEAGAITVRPERIVTLAPALQVGGAAPGSPAGKWTHELAADVAGATGNSEHFRVGAGLVSTYAHGDNRWRLSAAGESIVDRGQESSRKLSGGADFEHAYTLRHAAYGRQVLEHDGLQGLDLRTTTAAGYSYHVLREPTHELRLRLGTQYRHEQWQEEGTTSTVGMDTGVLHVWDPRPWCKIRNEVTFEPSFQNADDYLMKHVSQCDFPLGTRSWALRLGLSNEYNSRPASGRRQLDTAYFAKLVFTWK